MRIVAGRWRGRPLLAPAGSATRPTADRVREALFSMLASRLGSFEGLTVLDAFAGTGALGLEALSRGAARATFVEHDRSAVEAIRTNIAKLGAEATVLAQRVETLGRATAAHHVTFLDPPYGLDLARPALQRLGAQGWLAPQSLVSVETSRDETLDVPGFTGEVTRDYGKARIHLLRYTPST
jgi:16S rRNA (guanine966-N2)-methyltransferase